MYSGDLTCKKCGYPLETDLFCLKCKTQYKAIIIDSPPLTSKETAKQMFEVFKSVNNSRR